MLVCTNHFRAVACSDARPLRGVLLLAVAVRQLDCGTSHNSTATSGNFFVFLRVCIPKSQKALVNASLTVWSSGGQAGWMREDATAEVQAWMRSFDVIYYFLPVQFAVRTTAQMY